jgi:uncharacterized protein (DUF2141 family)
MFRAAALLFFAALPFAGPRDPSGVYTAPVHGGPLCTLNLHITGFRDNVGAAGGLVFASSAGWPENIAKTIVHGGVPIDRRQAELTFQVPPGHYSAVVIHDENSNMKLDRNVFGIPKEGFGFSTNPRVVFSAPSFRSAEVPVACPATNLEIKLIYK